MKKNSKNASTLIKSEYYTGLLVKKADIDHFMKVSRKEGKKPVIIFGANWCPDVKVFDDILDMPIMTKLIKESLGILRIDVGDYDKNMHLMEYLGDSTQHGLPLVLIFDDELNLLNLDESRHWRTAREREPAEIINYFEAYANL